MPPWKQGSDVVERLLDQRHLQRVPADTSTSHSMLDASDRHVGSAEMTAEGDAEGAFALTYDAARKAAAALLAHQGLRATTAGGHIAVIEAIEAQFPDVPGLRSLNRLRRRRNQAEYAEPSSYDPISVGEVTEI